MTGRKGMFGRWVPGLGALLSAVALAVSLGTTAASASAQGTQAVIPGAQGQGPINTCFWGKPEANVGSLTEVNETGEKSLGPDTNVDYWATFFELPAGATVTLHGEYPHSRFMSFTAYKVVNGENGIAADSLVDEEINPDPGSINPFRGGEPRTAPNRSFTITISGEVEPLSPAPNTLYVGQEGHTEETQHVEIVWRVYRADRGLEADGGVGLPAPTYNPKEGGSVSGEGEVCSDLSAVGGAEHVTTTKIGLPEATYKELRSGLPLNAFGKENEEANGASEHPAQSTPRWEKAFNNTYLLAPFYRGTVYEPNIAELPTSYAPGYYPTPANLYMSTYVDRRFGPKANGENILVLHGKMPTHPDTYNGNPVSEDGSTQVRYWSLSNYTAIAKPTLLEAGSATLFDQEVPTDSEGYYTIVISLPQDRPANARPGCGVAWMNWGTVGDGLGDPYLDLLMIRNQLSNPTFEHSLAKVEHPGEEEAVLGPYYPHGTYTDKELFESEHPCEPAAPGTPHITSGSSPNQGAFTLGWSAGGEAEEVEGVTYTLQHKNASGGWETIASGLNVPEFTFSSGSQEPEGTWTYRVQATGEGGHESAWSGESGAVKVDRAGPPAPSAHVSRVPDYAGGGGWYKESVEVSFSANGPGTLPDGSEAASLEASSLTGTTTVDTDGSHTVCGTVENVLGEKSSPGCAIVQVEASDPSVQVSCPATAILDERGVAASYSASDGLSGLASSASGSIPISTRTLGEQTSSETATSNVGNQATASCSTAVIYAFSKLKASPSKRVAPARAVKVSFHLADALGYVTDGSGTLELAPTAGPETGVYRPASSSVNTGDQFENEAHGVYRYQLSTSGLSSGTWNLKVTLDDGTTHTTSIDIR